MLSSKPPAAAKNDGHAKIETKPVNGLPYASDSALSFCRAHASVIVGAKLNG